MKKKKILLVLLLVCTLTLTGCTSYLKDDNKKVVKVEQTGQNLVDNILCKPTEEKTLELYSEYGKDLSKLPECKNFKVTSGGYEGIWTTIFVKPLAWLILKLGNLVNNIGLGIILITLLIRIALIPFTKSAAMQSENLKKVQPELERLEKKYKNKTDQDSMMMKSQEMLLLYKKYNINPTAGCLFSFIQLPLFMAFYEALYRLPAVFEGSFLGFELGKAPWAAFTSGDFHYIIFVILVFLVTYFSFKLNSGATMGKEQEEQMKMMRNISLVLIGVTSFSVSVAIALYWISNSGFTIIQNLYVKRSALKNGN